MKPDSDVEEDDSDLTEDEAGDAEVQGADAADGDLPVPAAVGGGAPELARDVQDAKVESASPAKGERATSKSGSVSAAGSRAGAKVEIKEELNGDGASDADREDEDDIVISPRSRRAA